MPNPFDKVLREKRRELVLAMQALRPKLANESVNFFKQSFRHQGWNGDSFKPWKPRQKKDSGRAILVRSGRLRRSIRMVRVTANSIVIATDVPYARGHNEGFSGSVQVKAHTRNRYGKTKVKTGQLTKTGKERQRTVTGVTGSTQVKAHTRYMKLPRRQFMGDSPFLRKRLARIMITDISKVLNR